MRVGFNTSSLSSPHQYRGLGFYTQRLFKTIKDTPSGKVIKKIVEFNDKVPKKVDLIHYPAFTLFTKPPKITATPTIVTLHDLIPLKFPRHYPLGIKGKIFWHWQQIFLRKCSAIITDSIASKKDIINFVSLPKEKVSVIYLAADPVFKQKNKKINKYNLPKKFVLYVGDLNWNKNIVNLTKACLKLNYPLVIVGKQATNQTTNHSHVELKDLSLFKSLAKSNPHKIISLGFVPTSDLVDIYNLATLYAQPSRAEGFGLPILEAFACGCPVITSNATSLLEISGQAALLINPFKTSQLPTALKSLWQQPHLRAKMSKAGIIQAKQFSWELTAQQTIKVYEKVTQKN